jgi:methylmalonyl-CoA mutase
MSELELAAGFPAADEARWLELVEKVLAGRDFKRALVSKTRDGLEVLPLYGQHEAGRHVRTDAAPWTVFQRVDHPDIDEANRLARADIEGGADGLELVFPGAPGANGYGIGPTSVADLQRLFDGIDLSQITLRIDGGYESRPALVLAFSLVEKLGFEPGSIEIIGQSDPANGLFANGRLAAPYDRIAAWTIDLAYYIRETGLRVVPFVADGRAIHAGGGSEVQELAYCVADALEHIRVFESGGVSLEQASDLVSFTLAADADQFATIAKFRALRLLWARVQAACGMTPKPARVHAETAWRMMTRRDPWVNLLRTTVATTAPAIGGANSILVMPYTAALGLPDEFARRLARNTQLVLMEESGLDHVGDPAAGSGYVEAMTAAMAEAAWEQFQAIEAEGGMVQSLIDGAFQKRVFEIRESRARDIATRKEPITGVSEYPFLAELPVATLDARPSEVELSGVDLEPPTAARGERYTALVAAARDGATIADMVATVGSDWVRTTAVPKMRLAEPFERLRDASDARLEATGRRPQVFLATLGRMADFTPRASWARNVFEAGGIEAVGGIVYDGFDALIDAFRESRAELACICGTDAAYAENAAALAEALAKAGAEGVYLAGRPGDLEADLRAVGVTAFVYAGCDILSELVAAHERLGLAA